VSRPRAREPRQKRLLALIAVAAFGFGLVDHADAGVGARAGARQKKGLAFHELGSLIAPLTEGAWMRQGFSENARYRLTGEPFNGFLDRYTNPARESRSDWRSFWQGRYGAQSLGSQRSLEWSSGDDRSDWSHAASVRLGEPLELTLDTSGLELRGGQEPMPEHALQPAPAPELHAVAARLPCPPWQRIRPVTLVRWGAEHDSFPLLECDGSVASDALDRLSVIARPPAAPKPELPLPLEPASDGMAGEWLPQVKMLHPRLAWVVQRIADAFPGRPLYVISGYRRESHGSFHYQGRALDLFVMRVSNEDLFRVCHGLKDVGCGFYPNNKFVHVDVRPFGTGHPVWIDVAKPGEPSEYVDAWPGVIEGGALDWAGEG
jgi:hypothetical protein